MLLPAAKISLYDIVIVMEGSIVNKSFPEGKVMREEFKILNTAYQYIGTVLIDILKSITIESLLSQSIETWYLAPCLMKR